MTAGECEAAVRLLGPGVTVRWHDAPGAPAGESVARGVQRNGVDVRIANPWLKNATVAQDPWWVRVHWRHLYSVSQ